VGVVWCGTRARARARALMPAGTRTGGQGMVLLTPSEK
jgi:hypothetical protein